MFMYTIPVQSFLLKNQTVIDLTNTNAKRSLRRPLVFQCCVEQADKIEIIDGIRFQQGNNLA